MVTIVLDRFFKTFFCIYLPIQNLKMLQQDDDWENLKLKLLI
jgi:hypothetical protein